MHNTPFEDSEVSQVSIVGHGMLTVKLHLLNNPLSRIPEFWVVDGCGTFRYCHHRF